MTLGKRISTLRTQRKLSQEYLAEYMDVSRQAVSKWENDLSSPDTNNLIRLAELFGVSVEYLATGRQADPVPGQNIHPKLSPTLKRVSLAFFLIALLSHCIGLFSGEFTRPLLPVFPYLWYGHSTWAVILNVFTVLFTVGWITLLLLALALDRKPPKEP